MEKIKRGEDRVNIDKLSPSDNTEPDISGGYVIRHDKDRQEESFWTWSGRWFYVEPSNTEITSAQKSYIQNYISEFETALLDKISQIQWTNMRNDDIDSFIVNDFCSKSREKSTLTVTVLM